MAALQEIAPEQFRGSPFEIIGKQWMLVAAEKDGRCNAMTASWGGLGVMWGKNAAFTVVRPQRFTKECMEASPYFSLNFFGADRRDMFGYMGSASGRDEDKIAKAGLTVVRDADAFYFGEASAVLLCRKLYAQPYKAEFFVDPEPDTAWYPDKDYHTLYIGEVVRILAETGSC